MWRRFLPVGVLIIVILLALYLLLAKQGRAPQPINQPIQTTQKTIAPTQEPITRQNEDSYLKQTDSDIQTQLDQANQDIQSLDQLDTSASDDQDVKNINSL